MKKKKPWLYATLTHEQETRHLLIFFVNGSRETNLIQIINGVETLILTGTEYETKQKANALLQLWTAQENFRCPREGYAYEPLERTITLAKKMGFTIVYDARFKKFNNLTCEVPLSSWPGMTAKNGGGYVYALDHMRLHACPTSPPGSEPLVAPSDEKEFAAFMPKHIAILETVGPFAEFILAGDD